MDRTISVVVESLGHMGVGIGRHQGKVVMIPLSAPGDELEVEVVESHKSYDQCRIVKVVNPSPLRREPQCKYFGTCGGCQLQHLDITSQRREKQRILGDMMASRCGVPREKVREVLFGEKEFGYRCRLDLRVLWDRKPRLALSRRGSGQLIHIEDCMIARPRINEILEGVESLLKDLFPTKVLRVEIACDDSDCGFTLFLGRRSGEIAALEGKRAKVLRELEGLRSICTGRTEGGRVRKLWVSEEGTEGVWIRVNLEHYGELALQVWPGVFSQVNPEVNQILVNLICSWARELEAQRVLDLYAGMGNLTIPLSRVASKVTAVELDPRAVDNGIENCKRLQAENVTWIRQSALKAVSELISKGEKFDLVLLDPPRAGAKEIIGAMSLLQPKAFIYVSCDPATLARDIGLLQKESDFRVKEIVPLDMFPQTYHIESASLLVRTGEAEGS